MSKPLSTDQNQLLEYRRPMLTEIVHKPELQNDSALVFLLQEDPAADIQVELVDHPLDLPEEQFEALLVDSECEV